MIQQSETIMEEEKNERLKKAIELVEKLESQIDILTLNKAIAIILDQRSRSKLVCQDWLAGKLQDIEKVAPVGANQMHPLVLDLS